MLLYERYALTLGPERRELTTCPVGGLLFIGGEKNIVSRFVTVGDVRFFLKQVGSFLSDPRISTAARISGTVKIHHDAHPPCLGVLQSSI